MKNEKQLILRLKAGDECAFEEVMLKYWDMIFNRANQLLNNRQDAEEVAQDTFLKMRTGIKNFRGESSLSTWIYQIVTNLSRNRYWYWLRRRRGNSYSLDATVSDSGEGTSTFMDFLVANDLCPVEAAITEELQHDILEAAQELSEEHRAVLNFVYLHNMSYEDIAEELDVTVGTVKSRISRARENLRALVAKKRPCAAEAANAS